jgi:hypothetical protein
MIYDTLLSFSMMYHTLLLISICLYPIWEAPSQREPATPPPFAHSVGGILLASRGHDALRCSTLLFNVYIILI